MAFRLPDICKSAIQKTCPDCGGKPGDHSRGRCDDCHVVARDARFERQRRQLESVEWWVQSAMMMFDRGDAEGCRDALIGACQLLSRRIRQEGGK